MKSLSLSGKMSAIFAILILVSLVIAVVGVNRLGATQANVEYTATVARKAAMVQDVYSDMTDIIRIEKNFIIEYNAANNAGWVDQA